MDRELKETRKTMYKQNGTINWERENLKKFWSCKVQEMKWKTYLTDSKVDVSGQKKKSANLKIRQWKLLSWGTERRRTEEKQTELKGPVGYHQADQHMHWASPKRRERIFEKTVAKKKLPTFNEIREYKHPRSWRNSK